MRTLPCSFWMNQPPRWATGTPKIFSGLFPRLRAKGVAIVYISHRFEELVRVADRVTVLRDGQSMETRAMAGTTKQDLIRLMVGRELDAVFPPARMRPARSRSRCAN